MAQLRSLEEGEGHASDLQFASKKKSTKRSKSPSKKKTSITRKGGLSSDVSTLLDELDFERIPLDELQRNQNNYLLEYSRFANQAKQEQRSMHWTLGDYMSYRFIQAHDNIMKAAVKMHKHVGSICAPEYGDHPFIEFNKKLLGIDGHR